MVNIKKSEIAFIFAVLFTMINILTSPENITNVSMLEAALLIIILLIGYYIIVYIVWAVIEFLRNKINK